MRSVGRALIQCDWGPYKGTSGRQVQRDDCAKARGGASPEQERGLGRHQPRGLLAPARPATRTVRKLISAVEATQSVVLATTASRNERAALGPQLETAQCPCWSPGPRVLFVPSRRSPHPSPAPLLNYLELSDGIHLFLEPYYVYVIPSNSLDCPTEWK